jgi:8-oxo-dGTP diphosphatase
MAEHLYYLGIKAIIRNDLDHILILKHSKGCWDFPGGRVQQGEETIHTLLREVSEETGITHLQNITPLRMKLLPVNIEDKGLILWYHNCKITGDDIKITLSDEHTEYLWLGESEAFHLTNYQ